MKVRFFFVGPPSSASNAEKVKRELNEFLASVKVVQVLQSSAGYTEFGAMIESTGLAPLRIETQITVLYEPKEA